jgi:diguanylate cyclase (GGDEF)-like protein
VTGSKIEWGAWLRAIPQATTFFGLAMIALIWGAVEFHLSIERNRSEAGAIQSTGNLARVFEEQIIRTIRANDRMLRSLQLSSVNGTLQEDFKRWAAEVNESSDFTIQLGLVNADGLLIGSSLGPIQQATRLGDRDYFKAHLDSADAGLFIGKSIVGRMSGKWSIPLTRALRTPHGEFAGIVFASLSSTRLAQFYASIDLGSGGAIMVVGRDGGVRASAGMKVDVMERPMVGSQLLQRIETASEGFYYSQGKFDGTDRIASFRAVEGFPLAVWVGRAEADVFGNYWRNSNSYRFYAAGLTLFILIIVFVNVRHRKGLERARLELRASEANAREKSRELELTLDHMSQGIMMVDPDHTVALINRQATKLLGLPQDFTTQRPKFDEVLRHQWANGEFGLNGESVEAHVRRFIKSGGVSGELAVYERTRPNGIVLEINSNPLPNGGFVRTYTDISDRKRNENKIAHMAHHDALSGLCNRVLLTTQIEIALGRQRRQGEEFALLLVDLDRFKPVNDTFGHAAGDELLRCVAQRLRECVREVDVVARLGGDEFAILQVATTGRACVETLARRVVDVVSAPYLLDGHPASVGASIGIARSADSPEIEQLFQNADLALYRVKAEGRNSFRLFEPEMNAAAQAKRQMEQDLRHALAHGEFEIFYQPMFDLATGKVTSVEALLRWNHPLRGRIAPDAFMPVAEEIGLMPKVDAWVLETACTEAVGWPGGIVIAVNLSPAIFGQHTLTGSVRAALVKAGLPARRLELEISERIMLQEESSTLEHLRSLQDLGVRVALDDFGVAHSSLSDLRLFSFDKIKIDRSFVAEMEISQESAAIVAAIAGLGRSLGAVTTAEGIETQSQADLARAAGCIEAQGYLYSRPVPVAEIRALLNEAGARTLVA